MDDFKYKEPNPNQKPAGEKWNERYQQKEFLFGREPMIALKHLLPHLKLGRAIDIAMGEGRNAVFLAKNGFQVDGIDASSVAIDRAKKLALESQVSVEAKVQNLDFFLMPLMKFDSVVMGYFRPQARFFSEVRRGLVPGGTFLLEAYTSEHMKGSGAKNPNLDFEECYKPNEVLSYLKDFHILYYREIADGDVHTVQVLARKNKA
jgi:tellurite methyltransferase